MTDLTVDQWKAVEEALAERLQLSGDAVEKLRDDLEAVTDERDECEGREKELRAEVGRLKDIADAYERSGLDVSPCIVCGKDVVCLPDGLPMCEACAACAACAPDEAENEE